MKKIDKNNEVFSSQEFMRDKYKFSIILGNLDSEELELYSDEENYIICRGSKNWPAWIWTKDNFDRDKLVEIEQLMIKYLVDGKDTKFTCKKELYDLLIEDNYQALNKDDYFEMGFLLCSNTKKPKACDGYLSRAIEDELNIIAKYWFDDSLEMNNIDPISEEQAINEARDFIESDTFFVLRNNDNKIVSMASYSIIDDQAKLSHVYTPKEERGKGYATNLIYLMTNKLLADGYVPLLYTDYNYIPSNKAYINAGYKDMGILINFSCSKEKLINKLK